LIVISNMEKTNTSAPWYARAAKALTIVFLSLALVGVANAGMTFLKRSSTQIYESSVDRYNGDLETISKSYLDMIEAQRDLAIDKFESTKNDLTPTGDNTVTNAELKRLEDLIKKIETETTGLRSGQMILEVRSVPNANKNQETVVVHGEHDNESHKKLTYNIDGTHYVRFVESYRLDRIKEVGAEFGILPEHLVGVCLVEGFFVDNGVAYGCHDLANGPGGEVGAFQIHPQHREDVKNARDFDFSLEWTARRMQRLGYESNDVHAVSLHNGHGQKAKDYAKRVFQIANQIKDQI
jgi:hypothetical protein